MRGALRLALGALAFSALAGVVGRAMVPMMGEVQRGADGRRSRTIAAGTPGAPLAVLIHGLGGEAENFTRVIPLLDGWRVLAPDRAGAGRSDPAPPGKATLAAQAARIAALIEAEGAGPAVVFGHSLGAAVALQLAADRPDLVGGLVLSGGLSRPSHLGLARPMARLALLPPLREALSRTLGPTAILLTAPYFAWACFSPHPMPRGFLRWGGAALLGQPRALSSAWRDIGVVATCIGALQARLPAITAPTVVLHGAKDRILPPHVGRHAADTLPNARLQIVDDAGHMLPVTHPQACADAIRSLRG